jgi:hypothetical protein
MVRWTQDCLNALTGMLMNFNVTKLKDRIKRFVLRRLTFVLFAPFVVQLCLDRTVTCRI